MRSKRRRLLVLALVFLAGVLLYFLQTFLCTWDMHLCSNPLLHFVYMDKFPSDVRSNILDLSNDASTTCSQFDPINDNISSGEVSRPVIVLSTPKSGSSWFVSRLGTHKDAEDKGEVLYKLQFKCQTRDCSFKQNYSKVLDDALIGVKRRKVIIGKVQYAQIPDPSRTEFANWVFCRNVSIIHFYRAASVTSFWSYQIESWDVLQSLSTKLRFTSKEDVNALLSNNVSLKLDPGLVSKYVRGLDTTRNDFRKLLKYHPGQIPYMEVAYEDVHNNRNSDKYWAMVLSFLGLGNGEMGDAIQRLHHKRSCREKISNWDSQIANTLIDTESYFACLMF